MNNSKIWLVVHPTIGVPIFLSAVAVGSFAVHVAVLSNTTWVADFLSGKELGAGSAALEQTDKVLPASASNLQIQAGAEEGMIVTLPDGRTARLVIDTPVNLASAEPGAPPLRE
ncbi:MAG: light-harvesting protein [Pseudomonadota bacterium]